MGISSYPLHLKKKELDIFLKICGFHIKTAYRMVWVQMNKFKLTENVENKMATIISGHNKADFNRKKI
jgi:hypothetical protein